ncbi:MAG: M10 family metallopeptidase C-terminal domain-containing protein [Thalassobaculales bacterium]
MGDDDGAGYRISGCRCLNCQVDLGIAAADNPLSQGPLSQDLSAQGLSPQGAAISSFYIQQGYGSNETNINALLPGSSTGTGAYRWNSDFMYGKATTVTYSFMTSAPSYFNGTFSQFNSQMKSATREILAKYSAVTNLTFVEVTDSSSVQIRFGVEVGGGSYSGYAYYPLKNSEVAGDVWITSAGSSTALTPSAGNYGYSTIMHEIGHAVGLKHPGNYNATGGGTEGPYLPSSLDNLDYTVMSYNNGSTGEPSDLGVLDISALQFLYGPKTAATIGGTLFYGGDAGEALTGGAENNSLFGNAGNDTLSGGSGNDGIMGGTGDDYIDAGTGNDLIYGNQGTDLVLGGTGNDTIFGGQNGGPAGNDGVLRVGADTIYGEGGNDLIYGNHGSDELSGGSGNDTIFGGQDQDTLVGDSGSDSLIGNAGNDYMIGGDGLDYFHFGANSGNDTIADFQRLVDYVTISSNVNGSGITTRAQAIAAMSDTSGGTVLNLGAGNTVTIIGVSASNFSTLDILII